MSINLSAPELLQTFNHVSNRDDPINWALFGYEGKSNSLRLLETGTDGLFGLSESFNDGQIQYGIAAIHCATTAQPKIILIHWQGEGVAITRQGACTSHFYEVKNYFKGVHVTHHARNEDDVEPSVLQAAIDKVTASLGVCSQSQSAPPGQKLVGSVYQKVEVKNDINLSDRDKFWADREREERERQIGESKRMQEQATTLESDKAMLASRLHKECEVKLDIKGKAAPPKHRMPTASDQMRLDRLNEANELIGQKGNLKSMWETKGRPEKVGTNGNANDNCQPQPIRSVRGKWPPSPTEPIAQDQVNNNNNYSPKKKEPVPVPSSPSQTTYTPPAPQATCYTPPAPHTTYNPPSQAQPAPVSPVVNKYIAPDIGEMNEVGSRLNNYPVAEPPMQQEVNVPHVKVPELPKSPHRSTAASKGAVFGNALPPRQESESENETNDEDWQDPPPAPIELLEPPKQIHIVTNNKHSNKLVPHMGIQAQALWDYQAADDTEVTFDPGEILTHIEQIDPGWWRGRTPSGQYGLFPANYVQLIEP